MQSATDRFMRYVSPEPNSGCWLWAGSERVGSHYGAFRPGGSANAIGAHRAAYLLFVGPIPDGLLVCHHCDTPPCVNPDHLFPGTHKDNAQDMIRKGRQPDQTRTHCFRGHEFTPDNVYVHADPRSNRLRRSCRTCMKRNRPVAIRAPKPMRPPKPVRERRHKKHAYKSWCAQKRADWMNRTRSTAA